jgi:Tol biopolymer transport system component
MRPWLEVPRPRGEDRSSRVVVRRGGSAHIVAGASMTRATKTLSGVVGILILISLTSGLDAQPPSPSLANINQVTPERDYVAPAWSPVSADQIAFAPKGFAGLYLMTLSTKEITLLTSDVASGFQFVWAPDGEHIVYRAKQDPRNSIIEMVNLRTKLKRSLSIGASDIGLPSFKSKGRIAYSVNGRLEETAVDVTSRETPREVERPVVFQRDDQIFVAIGGGVGRVSKLPGKYYLPTLSPDGTKVVYEEISRGIYMSNVAGSDEAIYLGQGNNPKWSPDGAYIVYEIPIDNGHVIISSSLYVFDVVGRKATRLINAASTVDRRPSFSADGARIAFDANGAIYIADFVR